MSNVYLIEKTIYDENGRLVYSEIVCALSSRKALAKAMEKYHECNKYSWRVTKKDITEGCEYVRTDTEGYKFKMKMIPKEMYVCNADMF